MPFHLLSQYASIAAREWTAKECLVESETIFILESDFCNGSGAKFIVNGSDHSLNLKFLNFQYQSKSITPVDEYVCGLSDELKKLALEELRESDDVRNHSIKAMRDWIMDNPRIEKCRMDSKFILRFLRFRKFSIPMAQEAFERYLVFREGVYGHDWFSNLDFAKPGVQLLLESGLVTVLANRDKLGRKVLLFRLAVTDPKIPTIGNDVLTLSTMFFETLLDDEENQIRGLSYIGDVSGVHLSLSQIFSIDTMYKFGKNVEVIMLALY